MILPAKLFVTGKPLDEEMAKRNKYTRFAYDHKLANYRTITIGDIVANKWRKDVDIPSYLMDFIGTHGEVLMIANIVGRKVPQMVIRALDKKEFSVMGKQTSTFYGFGFLPDDFKYGDWVVLVEGSLDRDVIAQIYPATMATLTAGLSSIQKEVLRYLTDKVVLMYDNDDAGKKAKYRDFNDLKKMGFTVRLANHPNIKDPGDIAEMNYLGKSFDSDMALSFYKQELSIKTF